MKKQFIFTLIFILISPFFVMGNFTVENYAGLGSHGHLNYPAQFNLPSGIAYNNGQLFVADTYNNLIRRISQNREVSTIAGNVSDLNQYGLPRGAFRDGNTNNSYFNLPVGIALYENQIFVSDSGNNAIRLIENNRVTTVPITQSGTTLSSPTAIVADNTGNLYVANTGNHTIIKIPPSGVATIIAGALGESGFTNGTGAEARFSSPMGLALSTDNQTLYVSDTGNNLIREINLQNTAVTTLVGPGVQLNLPMGLAYDNDTLYVADSGNHSIKSISPTGNITTIAGTGATGHTNGPALSATFHFPVALAIGDGNIYVSDSWNNMIRLCSSRILP